MSTTLREGELQISLPKSVQRRKFDDNGHGLSHCMKAVDWIIDLPDKVYLVEVKDLDAWTLGRQHTPKCIGAV